MTFETVTMELGLVVAGTVRAELRRAAFQSHVSFAEVKGPGFLSAKWTFRFGHADAKHLSAFMRGAHQYTNRLAALD